MILALLKLIFGLANEKVEMNNKTKQQEIDELKALLKSM